MLTESQLRWRCRRGVRELDVLFNRFVAEHYPNLSSEEQGTFQEMLSVQDPVIMDWLFGKYLPDELPMQRLIERLKTVSGLAG